MPNIFFPSSKPRFVNTGDVIGKIKEIALRIADKNKDVEEIYLFGSYATGNAGLRSDVDVLVVISSDSNDKKSHLDKFILAFAEAPVPVDVLVCAKEKIEKGLKEHNQFLIRATSGIRVK